MRNLLRGVYDDHDIVLILKNSNYCGQNVTIMVLSQYYRNIYIKFSEKMLSDSLLTFLIVCSVSVLANMLHTKYKCREMERESVQKEHFVDIEKEIRSTDEQTGS